jgi:hypothetical protein
MATRMFSPLVFRFSSSYPFGGLGGHEHDELEHALLEALLRVFRNLGRRRDGVLHEPGYVRYLGEDAQVKIVSVAAGETTETRTGRCSSCSKYSSTSVSVTGAGAGAAAGATDSSPSVAGVGVIGAGAMA